MTEGRSQKFKTDKPNALVSVDSMVNWSDHAAENKTGEVEKVYGMMAGLHADNGGADVSEAAALSFAMIGGISPKAQKEERREVKYEATLIEFENYFGEDEVFDLSRPSTMYPEPVEEEVQPLYSRFVKAGEMHAVPPSITGTYMPTPYKSDIEETQTQRLMHPVIQASSQRQGLPPAVDIKNLQSLDVEEPNSTAGGFFPSSFLLENVKSPRIFCNKVELKTIGMCVKQFNFVVVKSKAAMFLFGSRTSVCFLLSAVWICPATRNRPSMSISAGRPYILLEGVLDRQYIVPLLNLILLGDPSTDNDIGIVDSGCSRSMTGNKEKLDDFVQKNSITDETSGGRLRIPRERGSRTPFSISELQPEQNVTCLVAKASLDESTRWHRRMAHVNFKTINKLAKEGYTRFKTDKPAGTQETNINAGTQDHDSDSEVDEQVIVVPSFPSNVLRSSSQAHGLGYGNAMQIMQKSLDPAGIDSAGGVSAGSASAGSDPAGGNPAGSFQPAGSYEPTGQGNPAVSTSVSADFIPVHADESTLPLGIFIWISPFPTYDDDFSATLKNLAPAVEQSSKIKLVKVLSWDTIQDQQRTNHTKQLHCSVAAFISHHNYKEVILTRIVHYKKDSKDILLYRPVMLKTLLTSLTWICKECNNTLMKLAQEADIVATSSTDKPAYVLLLLLVDRAHLHCERNPVFHQRTKHIEIRHHFIRDANEKNLIQVVNTVASCISFLLAALFLLVAMDYADGSVFMLVGIFLLVDPFLLIGCVFLLSAWFLLLVDSFCWLTTFMLLELFMLSIHLFMLLNRFVLLDTTGWLISATSHLVSDGSLQSCWCNNVSAA
ncbi:ribonuclease H-like domain-containing protein [Tanacetum coccineum]|uniref:Ribonuclease H-like domain-containing protein n=1 Tax=Tanacetum coccineum TaxID=301880 RepID=A0ABQ5DY15_9ASTR